MPAMLGRRVGRNRTSRRPSHRRSIGLGVKEGVRGVRVVPRAGDVTQLLRKKSIES